MQAAGAHGPAPHTCHPIRTACYCMLQLLYHIFKYQLPAALIVDRPYFMPLLVCVQVLETLVRLKKKDPVLKQPDVVLFPQPADSDEGAEAAADGAEGKKAKPMYLRTVLAKQVRQHSSSSAGGMTWIDSSGVQ